MSEEPTPLTAAHLAYVAAHTAGDDELLRALKQAARQEGLPPIWISTAQASLLQILLRLAGAREVVEVGTLGGYSAIAMARALPPPKNGQAHDRDGRRSRDRNPAYHAG